MSGRLLRILLAVAGPVFIGALAVGQAINSAQIHGSITDPTGAAIVGAEIKATQVATGLARTTASSDAFNLLNHPNLGVPTGDQSSNNFGLVTGQLGSPRLLQAAAKFTF